MKLAEALAERADAQKRVAQLLQRVQLSARTQEGETPPEDPNDLLREIDGVLDRLEELIREINRTNASIELEPGVSMTDALARRDVLAKRRGAAAAAAEAGSLRHDRYSRSEVKFVTTLDVSAIRRRADQLAKEYRELDARIQSKNWEVDLRE
jgi:hypothetical protein